MARHCYHDLGVTNGTQGLVRFSRLTRVVFIVPVRHVCFGRPSVPKRAWCTSERRNGRENDVGNTAFKPWSGVPVSWFFEYALDGIIDISQYTWTRRRKKNFPTVWVKCYIKLNGKRMAIAERPTAISTPLITKRRACIIYINVAGLSFTGKPRNGSFVKYLEFQTFNRTTPRRSRTPRGKRRTPVFHTVRKLFTFNE